MIFMLYKSYHVWNQPSTSWVRSSNLEILTAQDFSVIIPRNQSWWIAGRYCGQWLLFEKQLEARRRRSAFPHVSLFGAPQNQHHPPQMNICQKLAHDLQWNTQKDIFCCYVSSVNVLTVAQSPTWWTKSPCCFLFYDKPPPHADHLLRETQVKNIGPMVL